MNLEGAIRILQSRGFREAESFAEKTRFTLRIVNIVRSNNNIVGLSLMVEYPRFYVKHRSKSDF